MRSERNFSLEIMLLEHIISQIRFQCLGLFSLLVGKLEPNIETDAEFVGATAVKDTHSSNLLGVRDLL